MIEIKHEIIKSFYTGFNIEDVINLILAILEYFIRDVIKFLTMPHKINNPITLIENLIEKHWRQTLELH